MPSDPRPFGTNYIPNTSKRMPVVFVLDASGSMLFPSGEQTRMDVLNKVVERFLQHVAKNVVTRAATEVAFVVFTDEILLTTNFLNIRSIKAEEFHAVNSSYRHHVKISKCTVGDNEFRTPHFSVADYDDGTKIGAAVLEGLRLLENRRKSMASHGYYVPFLILITDGHPDSKRGIQFEDEDQEKAIQRIKESCEECNQKDMIVPFIIGVGSDDIGTETLAAYSGGFIDGFFHVRDEISDAACEIICDLICKSLTKSFTPQSYMIKKMMQDSRKKLDEARAQLTL